MIHNIATPRARTAVVAAPPAPGVPASASSLPLSSLSPGSVILVPRSSSVRLYWLFSSVAVAGGKRKFERKYWYSWRLGPNSGAD